MDDWDVADELAESVDSRLSDHWTALARKRTDPECWWRVYREGPLVFVGHAGKRVAQGQRIDAE
jgi:hypothetical protein